MVWLNVRLLYLIMCSYNIRVSLHDYYCKYKALIKYKGTM
jgi:hypothetical protein